MRKYIRGSILAAAFFACAIVLSCCSKKDMELSLDAAAQEESAEVTAPSDSPAAGDSSDSENSIDDQKLMEEAGADAGAHETAAERTIFVYICGAVKCPDVYDVSPDSRVIDVIRMAGGFTDEADSDYHNLAGVLSDGQKIYVPTEQEVSDGAVPAPELNTVSMQGVQSAGTASAEGAAAEKSGKVNINTATLEELKTLSGIGDKRAQDIIDYRNSNGSFRSIEDIKKVNGIKDGIFNRIKDQITV